MNEKIKQLALDAGIGFTLWDDSGREMIDNYTPEERLAKFAELIVRECADLFVDRRYMVLNPLEPFADERVRVMKAHDKDTVKTIKKHFGVEE